MTMNRSTTHAHAKEATTAVAAPPAPVVVPHVIPPSTPPPPPPSNASGKGGGGGPRGGIYDPFPIKFYRMLDQTRDEGLEAIVSWLSHGRSFRIHKPKVFEATVMPRFFNQSKYTSFQRQLNLYGFTRCCRGRDAGAYHHPLFLRGRRELLGKITRTKIKGNGHKTMRVETEPDFHAMAPLPDVRDSLVLVSDAPSVASSVGSVASSVGSVPTLALGRPTAAAPPTVAAPSAARRPPKKRLPPPSSLPPPSLPSEGVASAGNFASEFQPSVPPSASHFANEPNNSNFATQFKPGLPPSLPSETSGFSRVSSGVSSPLREAAAASPVDFVNDLNKSIFIHELAVGCSILCQLRNGAPHL